MAEKVLSQEEMDALLKEVGQVPGKGGRPASGARAYDLSNKERFIPRQIPTLEVINDEFARLSQNSISSTLQKPVEFKPKPLEVLTFTDLAAKISVPSNINILKMDPLKNMAMLVIDAKVIYLLLDYLFGGKGQIHAKGDGDFTRIEQRFINKIVTQMVEDMKKAWQPIFPVKVSISRTEVTPQLASICSPSEMVVVAPFRVKIHNDEQEILFCLPYPTLEPIKDKLYSMFQAEQKDADIKRLWTEHVNNEVFNCRVYTVAELGGTTLDITEISQLQIGDVVMLDKSVIEDLTLKVEGKVRFLGRPGVYRGNVAFQITQIILEEMEGDES